jgi:MFS family permease
MSLRRIDYKWVVLGVAFLTLLLASGVRTSFGVFLTPMQVDFGTGRAPLALAVSIGMLVGAFCQPLVGKLADALGARLVLATGAVVMGVGLIGLGFAQSLLAVYLLFGLLVGAGFSAAGIIPSTTLITRWFVEHKGLALSIALSGFAVGQIVLVPLNAQLILAVGWRLTYVILGLSFILVLLPVILWLAKSGPEDTYSHALPVEDRAATRADGDDHISARQAMRTSAFWRLMGSFTVCGFTVGLIYTHLIPFAQDRGMSPVAAASLFALIGMVGIVGSIFTSSLSDRIGRKNPLAALYLMRGISLLLLAVVGGVVAFPIVALMLGLSRGTASLTSALTGDLYGRLSVGSIFGLVFLSHEVASAAGSYLGGLTFDLTGSYRWIFLVAAIGGILASITAFSILERGPQPTEAASTSA